MSNTPDVTETGNDTDAQTGREIVTIYQLSALPGIPGMLSPGTYEIDYEARTATPVVIDQSEDEQSSEGQTQPTDPDTTQVSNDLTAGEAGNPAPPTAQTQPQA